MKASVKASEIKAREIKGYIAFVKKIREDPKYKEMVIEGYLERDLKKAVDRYKDDKKFSRILRMLNLKGNEKILEFGCGRALASYYFAKKGCDVVALDMNTSKECGIGAIKDYKKFSDVKINAIAGDIEESPLKDDVFDVVYCNHVLHHAADMDRMVKQAVRSLKKGGMFIAQSEVMRPPFASDRRWRESFIAAQCGANEHLYTTFQYRRALKKAGLKRIKVESLVDIESLKKSRTLKGRIAYKLLRDKTIFRLFSKFYAYFGMPGNPILLYGWRSVK